MSTTAAWFETRQTHMLLDAGSTFLPRLSCRREEACPGGCSASAAETIEAPGRPGPRREAPRKNYRVLTSMYRYLGFIVGEGAVAAVSLYDRRYPRSSLFFSSSAIGVESID